VLVIATDVENVMVGWGTPQERALEAVTVAEMRQYAADDEFASGSMGPKVEAALRFIDEGGRCSVITSLDKIGDAIDPDADDVGTVITPG